MTILEITQELQDRGYEIKDLKEIKNASWIDNLYSATINGFHMQIGFNNEGTNNYKRFKAEGWGNMQITFVSTGGLGLSTPELTRITETDKQFKSVSQFDHFFKKKLPEFTKKLLPLHDLGILKEMKHFKNFNNWMFEKHLIKILHEGIKMVNTNTVLNESNTEDFAKREIELVIKDARKENTTALIEEFVPEIMALLKKFAESGQSGGSAPYFANAISDTLNKLMMFKPISKIQNTDEEWNKCDYPTNEKELYQNKRCFSLFKEGKDGKPYYSNAIVWKTPNGGTYTGSAMLNGEKIRSSHYVKDFPFEPKTFVIDVDETEVKPDDWEFNIKDAKQLEEVFKYYNKKND